MSKQMYYKKYNRGNRLQTIDTVYTGGMSYTNTPLAEAFSKTLVNYDVTKDNALRSRPGLVRKHKYEHDLAKAYKETTDTTPQQGVNYYTKDGDSYVLCGALERFEYGITYYVYQDDLESPPRQILDAQSITTFDTNHTYQHIVLGTANGEDAIEKSTLKKGALTFCRCDGVEFVVDQRDDVDTSAFACAYNTPNIHGLDVTEPMLRYVGTRAFNNDYYWFNTKGELSHAGYLLTEYDQSTNKATYAFTSEVVEPKECKMSEANTRGFNMLDKNPYAFDSVFNTAYTTPNVLTGLQAYKDEACTEIELTPQLGQTVYIKIVGEFRTKTFSDMDGVYMDIVPLRYTLECTTNNGINYDTLCDRIVAERKENNGHISRTSPEAFIKNCTVPYTVTEDSVVVLRATLTDANENAPTVLSTLITSFDFRQKKDTEAVNYDLQNYTLEYAEGMTFWKERLILWGVPQDKTMLFVSETRDPSYFPYPNNVNLFDEPIVNVVPLLDNLVVFTTSKIYIMGLDTDYIHLTQKCIQNNLRINPYDVHLMQVVKNMIFFKSGNYYYMIVPKAQSLTGELTIAPISKNIEYFLDNFKEELYTILETLYNYSRSDYEALKFVHYYNYLDYEDVTNAYVFKTPDGQYLNFCLLYNTVQRLWRIYIYESSSIMQPVTQDATAKSTYGVVTHYAYEIYKFDHDTAKDTMSTLFKNYQLYDSGYRDQEYNIKKRYRELQLIVYNRSLKTLRFGTGFFIDGNTHKPLYNMEPVIRALSDSKYNAAYTGTEQHVELVISHTFENVAEIPGATILGTWTIDQSVFPEQTVYKVRFPVAGKGYSPRVLLVNKDELQHDILNTSYVYRSLYSR